MNACQKLAELWTQTDKGTGMSPSNGRVEDTCPSITISWMMKLEDVAISVLLAEVLALSNWTYAPDFMDPSTASVCLLSIIFARHWRRLNITLQSWLTPQEKKPYQSRGMDCMSLPSTRFLDSRFRWRRGLDLCMTSHMFALRIHRSWSKIHLFATLSKLHELETDDKWYNWRSKMREKGNQSKLSSGRFPNNLMFSLWKLVRP